MEVCGQQPWKQSWNVVSTNQIPAPGVLTRDPVNPYLDGFKVNLSSDLNPVGIERALLS